MKELSCPRMVSGSVTPFEVGLVDWR